MNAIDERRHCQHEPADILSSVTGGFQSLSESESNRSIFAVLPAYSSLRRHSLDCGTIHVEPVEHDEQATVLVMQRVEIADDVGRGRSVTASWVDGSILEQLHGHAMKDLPVLGAS